MRTAEQNLQLLQEIEANRDFLLTAYAQNPQLLRRAEPRIRELIDATWQQEGGSPERRPFDKQRGISLIELIIFIVIISVALTGILLVMNQVTAHSADPLVRKQALAAAESLMEEIQLQDFPAASGAPATVAVTKDNRTDYHVVTDYNGFATTGIYALNDGTAPIPGLEGYDANVTVTAAPLPLGGIAAGSAVQITVTVGDVTLDGFRTWRAY